MQLAEMVVAGIVSFLRTAGRTVPPSAIRARDRSESVPPHAYNRLNLTNSQSEVSAF